MLKQHFKRDEFIGRINEILFFLPFTTEQLRGLAQKELLKWKKTAYDRSVGILACLPLCVCVCVCLHLDNRFAALFARSCAEGGCFVDVQVRWRVGMDGVGGVGGVAGAVHAIMYKRNCKNFKANYFEWWCASKFG